MQIMKFVVDRDKLSATLKHLMGVVERRVTIPMTGNLMIEAGTDGFVALTATDMDMELRIRTEAEVSASGLTTVSAQKLADIAANLDKGTTVEFVVKDSVATVLCGRRRFKLGSLDPADFPRLATSQSGKSFAISGITLSSMLAKTVPFVSKDGTRFYLCGVLLDVIDDTLRAVATNGLTLSLAKSQLPDGAEGLPRIIIPGKTCHVARKLFGFGDVSVLAAEHSIALSSEGSTLRSRIIDGSFPDYDMVIPKSNPNILNTEVKALRSAVAIASCIDEDKTKGIAVKLAAGSAEVSSATLNADAATDVIDVDYNGEPLRIGFDSKSLLSILDHIDTENVTIEIGDALSPVVLHGTDDVSSIFVTVPMRV